MRSISAPHACCRCRRPVTATACRLHAGKQGGRRGRRSYRIALDGAVITRERNCACQPDTSTCAVTLVPLATVFPPSTATCCTTPARPPKPHWRPTALQRAASWWHWASAVYPGTHRSANQELTVDRVLFLVAPLNTGCVSSLSICHGSSSIFAIHPETGMLI